MKNGIFTLFAVVLLFGAMDLKSQSSQSVCATSGLTETFSCPPPSSGSCSFNVPEVSGGSKLGTWYNPSQQKCCDGKVTVTNYINSNVLCFMSTQAKLNQPALQRLLEYAKTHEILVATCGGQYLPAQAVLRTPTPALSQQSLERRKSISDLGVR